MLELASRGDGPNGRPAERADMGVISGNGRSVAFVASGVLATDNVNGAAGQRDAYVRSLDDDTTHMVSLTTGDTRGSGVDAATPPAIDHTGARVAFVTQNPLSTRDADASFDAYVRNQVGGGGESTQLVSAGPGQQRKRSRSRATRRDSRTRTGTSGSRRAPSPAALRPRRTPARPPAAPEARSSRGRSRTACRRTRSSCTGARPQRWTRPTPTAPSTSTAPTS